MKLNLGCGNMYLDDYINVDIKDVKCDEKCDARKITFDDNTFEEVLASDIIEHFVSDDAKIVLIPMGNPSISSSPKPIAMGA